MKKILLSVLSCLLFWAAGYAQNSPATAYSMAENHDTSGSIINSDSVYYALTTTTDANNLTIYFTSTNGQAMWAYLYDHNGTTVLGSKYTYSTDSFSVGGLAAGTYYVEVYSYYGSSSLPYTIGNEVRPPAQSNDLEPNNNPSEADVLLQDDSVQGHVAYYYNNMIDTSDWYKLVTNGNGTIKIRYTSWNGSALIATLYDNTGTNQLGTQYSYSTDSFSVGSLGAGTYYVKITSYYNGAIPYSLYDSLVSIGGNDHEPNNNAAEADTLLVDSSVAGNVGYVYSGIIDSSDWFKIHITDGELVLTDTSESGSDLETVLYDSTGNLLTQGGSTAKNIISYDGLATGTFYVKLYSYFGGGIPYILYDSLRTYGYADDTIPNDHPYQAPDLRPDTTVTGHLGFLNDMGVRDSVDWYEYNFGGGDSTITLNIEPDISTGTNIPVQVNLYSDTSGSPVFSNYYSAATNQVAFSGIPQGHYYMALTAHFYGQFAAYSIISSTFTDLPVNLTSFSGRLVKDVVTLNWTTVSEQNNRFFEVQHSADGLSFLPIGKVAGNGTTSLPHQYDFNDLNPAFGTNYYRLRQVDFDGKSDFSKVIAVNYSGSESLFQLYPNPATDNIHLVLPEFKGVSYLEIFDCQGKSVLAKQLSNNKTNQQIDISHLASGIYLMVWSNGSVRQSWKVVKQ